jgi:methyltransferase family protein
MRFVDKHETKQDREYAPSFFDGEYVSETHAKVEELVADIRGKLPPADHYKLYEAGYFARGPLLEIGRLHGRSTVLLGLGIKDSGNGQKLTSIEFEDKYLKAANRNLKRFELEDQVALLQGDSSEIVRGLDGPFDTVFVDGDHRYEGISKDIDALEGKISPGGVVMFHDYFNVANETGAMGVKRAVTERAGDLGLEFRGRFGGIALFAAGEEA